MASLIPLDKALELILRQVRPVAEMEELPLSDALGRVLSMDVSSAIDVPPLDNSAMDGYALRFDDLQAGPLPISQRIAAGSIGGPLQRGTAARIFTGAPVPAGADTVVMQENTELLASNCLNVEVRDVRRGQHIRPRGQDIASGARVLAAGRRLQPADIGVLASIGAVSVSVARRLRVAVVSTGDELVEPGCELAEGKIYNSNRYMLTAQLQALGCRVVDGGIIPDDFERSCEHFSTLAGQVDIIVSSGGVSVGEEDHVKSAVEALGELALWKLNIKPGKPLAFGHIGETPFFGLPGNPASSFVTFALVARPYILRAAGQSEVLPLTLQARAGFDWSRAGSRQEYLRARVIWTEQGAVVERYPNQSSGVLLSSSWANALAIVEPERVFEKGDLLSVQLLSELMS